MCFGTETICPVCGSSFIQSGKGRTKDYCSDSCRVLNKYLSAVETSLVKVSSIDIESKKRLRSRFFSISNLLNSK